MINHGGFMHRNIIWIYVVLKNVYFTCLVIKKKY